MLLSLALSGLTTIPLPVLGTTWVVDDQAGPGVDFTTLQAAFDAAQADDVILVLPGTYLSSVLSKGVRVIGQGGPVVNGYMRVQDVPAGALAIVSGFRSQPFTYTFYPQASNCAGTVVFEDLAVGRVSITGSADVRLRGVVPFSTRATLEITQARVEAVECSFHAFDGLDQWCGSPLDPTGDPAAQLFAGAVLHAARSSFQGGDGGDSDCPDIGLIEPGGDGGSGIGVWGTPAAPASALVTGIAANQLAGGIGGSAPYYGQASPGYGIQLWYGSARVSGVTCSTTSAYLPGSLVLPAPPDPTLRLLEVPAPGVNLTFRLNAPPGSTAEMRIGAVPVVVPTAGVAEDVLVARAKSFPLGVVPANGIVGFNFAIPAAWPVGTTVFAQAVTTLPGGEVRRTHSIPLVVR